MQRRGKCEKSLYFCTKYNKKNREMKTSNIIRTLLLAPFVLAMACAPTPAPQEPENPNGGFVEKVPEEIVMSHAELAYIGDDIGEQSSDGWLLKLYTDMEIDAAGNPVGEGCVVQILFNAPYNHNQEPDTALLNGTYLSQSSSSDFAAGTFVSGYINYIDLPSERLELPDATFYADLAEGSTEMDVDLVDDGIVQLSYSGGRLAVEGMLVGKKCIKRRFVWSGTVEPKSYVEPEIPNSTLKSDLTLTSLTQMSVQDKGDYFALRDQSYRSLLIYLTEEGVEYFYGNPIGSGKIIRLELLVPWEWDASEGVPAGIYPMLTRNADTSIDRDAITPWHSIPGLPDRFTVPYWSGTWYVELANDVWSNTYARIDSGTIEVVRGEDGSHRIIGSLEDSSTPSHKVTFDVSVDSFLKN